MGTIRRGEINHHSNGYAEMNAIADQFKISFYKFPTFNVCPSNSDLFIAVTRPHSYSISRDSLFHTEFMTILIDNKWLWWLNGKFRFQIRRSVFISLDVFINLNISHDVRYLFTKLQYRYVWCSRSVLCNKYNYYKTENYLSNVNFAKFNIDLGVS